MEKEVEKVLREIQDVDKTIASLQLALNILGDLVDKYMGYYLNWKIGSDLKKVDMLEDVRYEVLKKLLDEAKSEREMLIKKLEVKGDGK